MHRKFWEIRKKVCATFFAKKFDLEAILWYNLALGIRLRAELFYK
jgi:hypothetical protein